MTNELEIALFALWEVLKKECRKDGNCVAVDIRFTASNYYVNYENRTAESLKKDYISMQNICGEFIQSNF